LEWVIVNDGSTDDSLAILQREMENMKDVVLLDEPHLGTDGATCTAIQAAQGELIGILDDDDLLFSRAVEKVVAAFQSDPTVDFLWTQYVRSDAILGHSRALESGETVLSSWPCGPFRTFRRSTYDRSAGLDPSLQMTIDRDLFIKLEEVGRGAFLDETLYFYRIHDECMSVRRRALQIQEFQRVRAAALARRDGRQDVLGVQ
jgi:glycosyltransferase involved in cell wall biosynthesis